MVDRYIAEAANAYNKPVTRELVWEDGSENDEKLDALQRGD